MIKNLLDHIEKKNIAFVEHKIPVKDVKGLYFDETIILDQTQIETEAEMACILAEEIGHYETSAGNILDQESLKNIKQEKMARRWAHKKLIPLEKFIDCFKYGCHDQYEVSERIGVTNEFLRETVDTYMQIYGQYVVVDDYIIYFEPLGVMKRI
ncbi:ImmA/IrrE family metallo-endopeptidase [Fusibacter ferrireducens]|uniref:ImmA/IrrE family metallo-endopeptidase n=1 Tax=Fusibacter ferrireducens TaxID=2785058 RepID=A0ABR9ZTV0_9FIRM|nr:ImmA/IrrE family metallo-endopeptidase [Fusibacter ferrireducens]MBF4693909.1 ImmA/IrrE family metallo-endopeptidase [Fusibacter ferrireducens]